MPNAVAVQLAPDRLPRCYRATLDDLQPRDFCVVEDPESGQTRVGMVAGFEGHCPQQWERLPRVVRRAGDEEIARWYDDHMRRREALALARDRAQRLGLPMKITEVRFDDANHQITFYFIADHRVDFRALVRELAAAFRARIELWQIGTRREAALKDGYGPCGQRMCCAAWLREQPAVAIRHARAQDIDQPPPKLAGACNRLRCCLRFEYDGYCELARGAPRVGARVLDDQGREGVVLARHLLTQRALVRCGDAMPRWIPFDQLQGLTPATATNEAPADEADVPVTDEDAD